MNKKFIVSIENPSLVKEKAFFKFLEKNSFGYWKEFYGMWIITVPSNRSYSVAEFRDLLQTFFLNNKMLVIEIQSGQHVNWAGYGKASIFEWFKNKMNW